MVYLRWNKMSHLISFLKNDWPRSFAINAAVSASFAPFDEEICVPRGFEADVGLVALDECGGGFSFVAFGRALAVDIFDVLAAGFRDLGMLKWNWNRLLLLELESLNRMTLTVPVKFLTLPELALCLRTDNEQIAKHTKKGVLTKCQVGSTVMIN